MQGGHQIRNQYALHFLTFTVVDWVDVFSRKHYRDIIIENFNYYRSNRGLELYAFVIMSNHVHVVVSANKDTTGLSAIVRDFKKFTARAILQAIETNPESRKKWMLQIFADEAKTTKRNTNYQFWTHDNHPIELYSPKWILQKIKYIHNNPVKAGWVILPEHYLYSSAANYMGEKGIIDVNIIDLDFTKNLGFTGG